VNNVFVVRVVRASCEQSDRLQQLWVCLYKKKQHSYFLINSWQYYFGQWTKDASSWSFI